MALLNTVLPFTSHVVDWDGDTGAVEASDIHCTLNGRAFVAPCRLYDDACDVGFLFVSPKTGMCKVPFTLVNEVRNPDNDVLFWVFEGWVNDVMLTLKVFND